MPQAATEDPDQSVAVPVRLYLTQASTSIAKWINEACW
jgi:hypothetical protein